MAETTKRRRVWKLLLAVPIVVSLAAWGLHAWALARSEAAIRVEIAKFKAIGIDIDAASRPLTKQEQALWNDLSAMASESEKFGPRPQEPRSYLSKNLDRELQRYVGQTNGLYERVRLKSHESVRFRAWGGNDSIVVVGRAASPTDRFVKSPLSPLSQLSEICKARADYYAARNWDTTLDALGTSLRLSRMGTGTMSLIKEDEVWIHLIRLRRGASLDGATLERTLEWIEANAPRPDPKLVVAADISAMLHAIRAASSDFSDFNFGDFRSLPDQLSTAWRTSPLPLNEVALRYLETEGLREHSSDVYADYIRMLRMHPPVLSPFLVKLDTHARMAYVVYWLEHQRRSTGKMPQQLPSEPIFLDGFTGQPFHYVAGRDKFVIRSLGPNQIDDQGEGDDLQVTETSP